jgi:hypothetical protein
MVDKNDSLLREVDEELRRERMEKIWQKYGIYLLAGAGLLVALVGGYKFLDTRNRAAAEAGGAQFEAAETLAKTGKSDEAAKAFEALASSDKPGYAALAELNLASALNKAGKPQDAVAAYDKLAARPGMDPLITGFAQLQAAALRVGEADFTEVKNRLTPLMNEGSAWKTAATEMLGTAAIKAGKLEEARTNLAPLLADPRLSRTAIERIKTLMASVAAMESSQPLNKTEAQPAASAAPAAPAKTPEAKTPGEKK